MTSSNGFVHKGLRAQATEALNGKGYTVIQFLVADGRQIAICRETGDTPEGVRAAIVEADGRIGEITPTIAEVAKRAVMVIEGKAPWRDDFLPTQTLSLILIVVLNMAGDLAQAVDKDDG